MKQKLDMLYSLLEDTFPYSTMGPDFFGAHCMIKDRESGELRLNIWYNGKIWRFALEPKDFKDIKKLVLNIKGLIEINQK